MDQNDSPGGDRGLSKSLAVVAGATGGVGEAVANELALQGADLALIGRNQEGLNCLAARLRVCGVSVYSYRADFNEDSVIRSLAERLLGDAGRVDILVHSAGQIALGSVADSSVGDFDYQYRVNVRGPFLLTQELLPALRRSKGQIVFINSTAGLIGRAGIAGYAATKHALKALADSLRDEVNGDGVRVMSVFLGRTATAMQAAVHAAEARPYVSDRLIQPGDVARMTVAALMVPRTAEVTEMTIRPMLKPC